MKKLEYLWTLIYSVALKWDKAIVGPENGHLPLARRTMQEANWETVSKLIEKKQIRCCVFPFFRSEICVGGLKPISVDTDNNDAMYNCC